MVSGILLLLVHYNKQRYTMHMFKTMSSLKILNLTLHSILFYLREIIIVHLFSYIENLIPIVINTIT